MKDHSDYDVFISYAQRDNEPIFKDQEGWIKVDPIVKTENSKS